MKIASAPISWGVCEVPGWGYQLGPDEVLSQMRELGIAATEFGPEGFLPPAPADKARTLAGFGLRAVGAFVPVVLHDAAHDPVPEVDAALDGLVAAEAEVLVLAAATGLTGYDERPELDDDSWAVLNRRLDELAARAAERNIVATLHPHVGTMVERRDEVDQVLAGSSIGLCLDTGHLLVGGTDPVELAEQVPDRIGHVHLKDVDAELAEEVRRGARTYTDAVRAGLFRPLGQGDVRITDLLACLGRAGYNGWYVLEQDVMLPGPPEPGADPRGDVEASLTYLRTVLTNPDESAVR